MTTLCIYHKNCADGLGAAWAVHRLLGSEVEFLAAAYGDEPPLESAAGRDVLIVDFSYPLDDLHALSERAASVLVLDHHASAQKDLEEVDPCTVNWKGWLEFTHDDTEGRPPFESRLAALFDMERSGAGLTWDFLSGGAARPRLIELVEDRDLWRFRHDPDTRRFHAVAQSYGYALPDAFALWDKWAFWSDARTDVKWISLMIEGAAILRAQDQLVASLVRDTRRMMTIGGVVVPVANVPGALASEAGHRLCQEFAGLSISEDQFAKLAFSATYYDSGDGKRHFSLRSPPGGAHVGEVAKIYGGGGHEHSAGFDRPMGWEGE